MTLLWDRVRELARDTGMVTALGAGRRAHDRTDEKIQDMVAALDDDQRDRLRVALMSRARCTFADVTITANLAGARRVEVLLDTGIITLCLLDDDADVAMVERVRSEVKQSISAGVNLFIALGPAWYPIRSYVEHHVIRMCTNDKVADLLARTERELIAVESSGRKRVEKRRRHWAEMARRLNAEIDRRRASTMVVGETVGQTFTACGLESGTFRLSE